MCGITGWLAFDRDLRNEREVVDTMTETMALRGPDAGGTWITEHIALGHRRLAVIDLPGGAQPMLAESPAGTVAIVYSGEVYNFDELRRHLITRGHSFTTKSDTEVVLRGYIEWGPRIAEHLNGMFAFAIWDQFRSELLLVRDRLGIKPLYYYPTLDGLLFGSEPKAILANPLAKKVVDLEGFAELFPEIRTPGGSPWKSIREVQPGTFVVAKRGSQKIHRYWKLPTRLHRDDRETTIAVVRDLITDTVGRQLIADVPQCALLSGGLDSSAVAGLAAGHLAQRNERLRTFSVDFIDHARVFKASKLHLSQDTPFALEVAGLVRARHTNIALDIDEVANPDIRRSVIAARDMPGLDQMDTSLYQLFNAIRGESTVALSGESADELFGGYPWFHDEGACSASTFPWLAWRSSGEGSPSPLPFILQDDLFRRLDISARNTESYASALSEVEHLDNESDTERRMRGVSYLALTRSIRTWLDRKDRVSMALGLEVRVPYCDHRLVEYVYNVPWSLKTFDGREKSILRHAAKHVIPRSVAQRRKSGYPATMDPRYRKALQRQAMEVLAEPQHEIFSFINREWLHQAVHRGPRDLPDNAAEGLGIVLSTYHWLDLYKPSFSGM